jgi:hypothetical protein
MLGEAFLTEFYEERMISFYFYSIIKTFQIATIFNFLIV